MDVRAFISALGVDFYTGIPDSQLKALCDCLMDSYGIDPRKHIIAANEGNCTALAAGYHLATGKLPAVYLQNSGEGNIINPVASLLNQEIYGIPCLFIIGWRGEPGIHNEPQHIFQGQVTIQLLKDMQIHTFIVGPYTTTEEVSHQMDVWARWFAEGGQAAFVVRKDALKYEGKVSYGNRFSMSREKVIRRIVGAAGGAIIVSTTGKTSRELFEVREDLGQGHQRDFLTVGSMGHSSSIALGLALQKPGKKIWCLDGDGATLMHMGAMAVIGANCPKNLVHILLNNQSHETVGGMPTVSGTVDWCGVAKACGYEAAAVAEDYTQLEKLLHVAKRESRLTFLEVRCSIGSRKDLGRPTVTPQENKYEFMKCLGEE